MPKEIPVRPEQWKIAEKVYKETNNVSRASRASGINQSRLRYRFKIKVRDWHKGWRKNNPPPYIKKPDENVLLDEIYKGKEKVLHDYEAYTRPLTPQPSHVDALIKESRERLESYNGSQHADESKPRDSSVLVLHPSYDADSRTFYLHECDIQTISTLEAPTLRALITKVKKHINIPVEVPGYYPLGPI